MIPYSSSDGQHWVQPSRLTGGERQTEPRGSIIFYPDCLPSQSETTSMSSAPSHTNGQQQKIPDSVTKATIEASSAENEHLAQRPKLEIPILPTGTDGQRSNTRPTPTTSGPSRIAAVSGRGRPASSFQELVTETYNGALLGGPQTAKPQSPPPFPTRPWKGVPIAQPASSTTATKDGVEDREVQVTPYHLEVPSIAPLLKESKVADFSPWTGYHPEDTLNEQTTKQGHYDRTQVSQNESNTARPSLYVQLKHRSGLQVLSSVFTAVLERRQAHNKLTGSSTFKPPPRVTLTDNKREIWLRDLANPLVPLRRLSRTIPHGIRGKVLLDQCVSKWIPIGRAIWLAKCVGANEIRAFKRKGTSGILAQGLETKWVRDWTASVQQFLEGVIVACGHPEWKMKITYAVRLTARLFYEMLLDQDCFLDWYLLSLETASLDTLPVWLLMLGVYWDHLIRYRRRARRLAELLLLKYHLATSAEPKHLIKPLIERLVFLICKLAREQTSALVLPQCWDKYHELVRACLSPDDTLDRALLDSLSVRNRYLRPFTDQSRLDANRFSKRAITRALDLARSGHGISTLSEECLELSADRRQLILELLEWAATPFRHGLVRVYIAVRLLRRWKKLGIDTDTPILSFLVQSAQYDSPLEMGQIYHIVVELVRSQTFAVSRYLEWLVARGVIDDWKQDGTEPVPSDIDLLLQLPMCRLPEHAQNLRNALLSRAGLASSEDATIRQVKSYVRQKLPALLWNDVVNEDDPMDVETAPKFLTWTVKAEIGQWIRRAVSIRYKDSPKLVEVQASRMQQERSALTPVEFFIVRDLFEDFNDLSMLADILNHAASSHDVSVLASAVDTLNRHLECFLAIGATSDIYRKYFAAVSRLKNGGASTYDLLYSLIELGHRIPGEAYSVSILRQEFARFDRKAAIAACSPMSDHMTDNLNFSNPAFNEELDQFFSSGNTMDENTLTNIFQTLSTQLGSREIALKASSVNTTVRHLVQLRRFNAKLFDLLMIRWVEEVCLRTERPLLSAIFLPLIGAGCITLKSLSLMVRKLVHGDATASSIPDPSKLYFEFLELLRPITGSPWDNIVSYRVRMSQEEFVKKHPENALGVIQDTVSVFFAQTACSTSSFTQSLGPYLSPLLRDLMVQHPESVTQRALSELVKLFPALSHIVRLTLDLILNVQPLSDNDPLSSVEHAINCVNNFSLPFCQLKIQLLFNSGDGENFKQRISDVMLKAAVADIRSGRTNWLDLAAVMRDEVVQELRQTAEKEFFSLFSSDSTEGDPQASLECSGHRENAQIYLTIMDGLASSISEAGATSITPLLVDKVNTLFHRLVLTQTNVGNVSETPSADVSISRTTESLTLFEQNFTFWFTAFLHMIVLNLPALSGSLSSSTAGAGAKTGVSQPDQMRLVTSICCIALSKFAVSFMCRPCDSADVSMHNKAASLFSHDVPLQTHALDVVGCLLENLTDEARQQAIRYLRDRCPPFLQVPNDPRLRYLLGPTLEMTASPTAPVTGSSPLPSGPSSAALTPGVGVVSGSAIHQVSGASFASTSGIGDDPNGFINRLRVQRRGRVVGPYPLRPWEMLEGAAPVVGANDTAIDLGYFGARRVKE